MLRFIMTMLIWPVFLDLTACSNHTSDRSMPDRVIGNRYASASQQADSLTLQKDKLKEIYTRAIAEFIKAAYQKDKTTFDTLYFGKHVYGQPDDFPDIELPGTIEKTQIRLVAPEVGQKMQTVRKALVYVNLMGWVDKEEAEFLFVVFSNGAEHQYDYYINFIYDASTNTFELDKIGFENYLELNGQQPKRITIYQDGKYFND